MLVAGLNAMEIVMKLTLIVVPLTMTGIGAGTRHCNIVMHIVPPFARSLIIKVYYLSVLQRGTSPREGIPFFYSL